MKQMPEQLEYFTEPEKLELFLKERHAEISKKIAEFLIWALENDEEAFIFADILLDDGERLENMQLGCEKRDYLEALEKQLNHMVEFEEFELCEELQKWITLLK